MIINHKYKFIFIKSFKTAGTSLEIALSKFCSENDIITTIVEEDEKIRKKIGYSGPRNNKGFSEHMSALEIKKKLKKDISNQKLTNIEYNLSQIVFEVKSNETFEDKFLLIEKSIKNQGFKNTSNLYSIAENAKTGGNLGWINQTQLSNLIVKAISNLNNGEITKPIKISNGFLMLKVNEKREKERKINFEKEFQKMIKREKNNQSNQFSIIYFNKIKQNIIINEL